MLKELTIQQAIRKKSFTFFGNHILRSMTHLKTNLIIITLNMSYITKLYYKN